MEGQGVVEQKESGRTTFSVFCPQAEHVEIVGTFTGWHDRPVAMKKAKDGGRGGWWRATVDLEPGDHEFQYLIDRREWRPDYAAGGLRLNEFGTWVSQLTVHQPAVRIRPMRTPQHAHAA
jgi:1,4-alpha-glucan branching enzyme